MPDSRSRTSRPRRQTTSAFTTRQLAKRMGADTTELASGHGAMVSDPEETFERIVTAANAVAVSG
jgi:hypothetical protein